MDDNINREKKQNDELNKLKKQLDDSFKKINELEQKNKELKCKIQDLKMEYISLTNDFSKTVEKKLIKKLINGEPYTFDELDKLKPAT